MVAQRPYGSKRNIFEIDDGHRRGNGCGRAWMLEVGAERESEA